MDQKYPLLKKLGSVEDLRKLTLAELQDLAAELRDFIQFSTSDKPGHIKSSLGVVELTIALHYKFNTPEDILVWDVGHQAYAHKIITGRRDDFHTNRKLHGISGFTKRSESAFDPFGAGHSSTSISAAIGFAASAKLHGIHRQHIAVIGDGAITGGESLEALNYLGEKQYNLIIVLNDNDSSIDENVGALAKYKTYDKLCEALKINYIDEASGNDLEALFSVFDQAKDLQSPCLIRITTKKALGWKVGSNETEEQMDFQQVFTSALIELARKDNRIVAITPAMLSGSGLNHFKEVFPSRVFDTGITEQHAVTMAAAMAASGHIPFCHLYSTFAQRAFDQIIHDVALQQLPVIFCLDRAGFAGEDGATHHGIFDTSFLSAIPEITITAPMDGDDLTSLMSAAVKANSPFVIRYPKAVTSWNGRIGSGIPASGIVKRKSGEKKAVLSYGAIGGEVAKAVAGTKYAHLSVLRLKPLDAESIGRLFQEFDYILTVEESSSAGGLGEKLALLKNTLQSGVRLKFLHLPDQFIEHGSRKELLRIAGLDAQSIATQLRDL